MFTRSGIESLYAGVAGRRTSPSAILPTWILNLRLSQRRPYESSQKSVRFVYALGHIPHMILAGCAIAYRQWSIFHCADSDWLFSLFFCLFNFLSFFVRGFGFPTLLVICFSFLPLLLKQLPIWWDLTLDLSFCPISNRFHTPWGRASERGGTPRRAYFFKIASATYVEC